MKKTMTKGEYILKRMFDDKGLISECKELVSEIRLNQED
jgi:hypothetical protein